MSIPLGGLRAIQERYMPQRCAVRRYGETNTPDGVEQGWTDTATDVPCRVSSPTENAAENVGEGAARATSEWVVWMPAGTDVTQRDRIAVDDGRVFEVDFVGAWSYETARDAHCVLVV